MKKRIHKKSWSPKVKPYELHNIFAHVDEKQYDMRRNKPLEWWNRMVEKVMAFNKNFTQKEVKANA